MATKVGEKYLCEVCKNEVVIIRAGKGNLVCCNRPMVKCGENSDSK
ncbi:MAG: desulfoferrodoxin FeS4 iron-binding domain-containing protein [Rubrobacteridae bacterium]|nr:desulfoferrodoxin FeS4 iron-binding domain-containing protein [Rubrobacteridae bacterium]